MTFKREIKDGCAMLKIEGQMTVNEASALHQEMVECFSWYESLILDLKDVTGWDVAGLQLLCSARLTAQDMGKCFSVAGASMSSIDILARAGFDPDTILGPA